MAKIHHATGEAPRSMARTKRVTIAVPGHGRALSAIAHSMQMPVAALVRTVVAEWLQARSVCDQAKTVGATASRAEGSFRSFTMRMPARYAAGLTCAARAAELSRGFYLARLLDGELPVPLPNDQRENWVALVQSTAALAAMAGDLHALMRAMHQASSPEQLACIARVAELSEAVQRHLTAAAPLIAASKPSRRQILDVLLVAQRKGSGDHRLYG